MRFFLATLFCLVSLPFLFSQAIIQGTIVDSSGYALPATNIVLLNQVDSALVAFSNSDNSGKFSLDNVGAGQYILRCAFLGHARPEQQIEIQAEDQLLNLGELIMYPQGFLLDGIEVNGKRIPIRMRGDTMVFDAAAFATGPNAVVEDLLRSMPGMSIDQGGAIRFNGKLVKEVMVDGKPFFKGNSQIVTKNLDAAAIEKVEVFDQKSDQEIVSGISDQEEDITLNLSIKNEAKGKVFGNLHAGAGTQERYEAGAKLFKISKQSQIGAIGLFNNINKTGFSPGTALGWGDAGAFGDNNEGQIPVNWSGNQVSGDNRTTTTGLNYGRSIGKRTDLSLSYVLLDRKQVSKITETDIYTGILAGRQSEVFRNNTITTYSHRIAADIETQADSISGFNLQLAAFTTGEKENNIANGSLIEVNDSLPFDRIQNNKYNYPNLSLFTSYSKRIGKAGRTINLTQKLKYGSLNDAYNSRQNGFVAVDLPGTTSTNDIERDSKSPRFFSSSSVSFTTPFSKSIGWKSSLNYSIESTRLKLDYFNNENSRQNYQLKNKQQQLYIRNGLAFNWGKQQLDLSVDFVPTRWQLSEQITKKEKYQYWLPQLSYKANLKRSNYRLTLQSDVDIPQNTDLQELAQVRSDISLILGNSSLVPSKSYNLINFYYFANNFSGLNGNIYLVNRYTDKAIGYNLKTIDQQQRYQVINVSHSWSHSINMRVEQRLDFIDSKVSLKGNANVNLSPLSVNDTISSSRQENYSATFTFNKLLNDKSFLLINYQRGWNKSSLSQVAAAKNRFDNISMALQVEVSPIWRLETDFGYTFYKKRANAPDPLSILNASLEVRPFKKHAHYFVLSANDLLNNNRAISQNAMEFLTRTTQSTTLGRYFMLSLYWKL